MKMQCLPFDSRCLCKKTRVEAEHETRQAVGVFFSRGDDVRVQSGRDGRRMAGVCVIDVRNDQAGARAVAKGRCGEGSAIPWMRAGRRLTRLHKVARNEGGTIFGAISVAAVVAFIHARCARFFFAASQL